MFTPITHNVNGGHDNMGNVNIITGTKRIQYQQCDCFLPVLIVQEKSKITGRTIRSVHISTGDPLVFKKDALKYANIWRNESLEVGYIITN
jgi:hypothetical protein